MSAGKWLLLSFAVLLGVYVTFVASLLVLGRRENARAIAGFVPDCAVLLSRLTREPGLPRRRWLVLVLVAGYLAMPVDLVPDFLPIVGYLDDAVVLILTLRWLMQAVGPERLEVHWPGPDSSLRVVLRLARAPERRRSKRGQFPSM
jgi:uncharacterized membrane protein YkvA (DUF1232 family)